MKKAMEYYSGKYFEDFEVGDTLETPCRVITPQDVLQFARLTGDLNPLHVDEDFARRSIFGKPIAHGMLTTALTMGLASELGIFYGTVIAFVECASKFLAPVYFGDTIKVRISVVEKKDSGKPTRGVAVFRCDTVNQNGVVVAETLQTLMLKKRQPLSAKN